MWVHGPCIVSVTVCTPLLPSPSVRPWHYLRSFGSGLNDTVNIYCMWQQTVLWQMKAQLFRAGVSVAAMKVPSASYNIQPVVWILSLLALSIYCCRYCKVLISPDGKSQLHNDLIGLWNGGPTSIMCLNSWGRLSAVFEAPSSCFVITFSES